MKPTPTPQQIEAACAAVILGEDEDGNPVHLQPSEAEAALSAALSVQPPEAVVGEPVAWQPRYKQEVIDHLRTVSDNVSEFAMTVFQTKAQAEDYGHGGHEVRPLYAAPSAPEGWQPIETAPRDGTVILARYQWGGESRFLVIRLSNMHRWWVTDHDGLIKHDEEKVSIRNYNFTHWRPLPAPPALGGKHD